MKNDPFWVVIKADLFVRLLHSKDCTKAAIGFCVSSARKVLLWFFCAIFFLTYFAFPCLFCCRLFQEVSGWSPVWRSLCFFLAHAVHARGSDGHQNVLWSISYSHVVREQVKSKKPGVFQSRNKANPKHKHKPNKHNKGRHPEH